MTTSPAASTLTLRVADGRCSRDDQQELLVPVLEVVREGALARVELEEARTDELAAEPASHVEAAPEEPGWLAPSSQSSAWDAGDAQAHQPRD